MYDNQAVLMQGHTIMPYNPTVHYIIQGIEYDSGGIVFKTHSAQN